MISVVSSFRKYYIEAFKIDFLKAFYLFDRDEEIRKDIYPKYVGYVLKNDLNSAGIGIIAYTLWLGYINNTVQKGGTSQGIYIISWNHWLIIRYFFLVE